MIGFTRRTAQTEVARQQSLAREIARLSESVSTGKRLRVGSDDPAAAARIAEIREAQSGYEAWIRNADAGAAVAAAADDRLESVATLLDRAKELLISGRSDTSANVRTPLASEMRALIGDLAAYAASLDPSGRALFPDEPIAIPVAESLSYTATASRASVFEEIDTAGGTRTLASILSDAADALDAGDPATMTAGLAALDVAAEHVSIIRTDQGIRGERFDTARERLQKRDTDLEADRIGLEGTDFTYALTAVKAKQLSLDAAQAIFAQTRRRSLFDLLG